jgi:hypothetical protein
VTLGPQASSARLRLLVSDGVHCLGAGDHTGRDPRCRRHGVPNLGRAAELFNELRNRLCGVLSSRAGSLLTALTTALRPPSSLTRSFVALRSDLFSFFLPAMPVEWARLDPWQPARHTSAARAAGIHGDEALHENRTVATASARARHCIAALLCSERRRQWLTLLALRRRAAPPSRAGAPARLAVR